MELLDLPKELIAGKTYNDGYQNHTVNELAKMVREIVGDDVQVERVSTDDNRSYHICSKLIERELGFKPKYNIQDAVRDLKEALIKDRLLNPFENNRYYNIKTMLEVELR